MLARAILPAKTLLHLTACQTSYLLFTLHFPVQTSLPPGDLSPTLRSTAGTLVNDVAHLSISSAKATVTMNSDMFPSLKKYTFQVRGL